MKNKPAHTSGAENMDIHEMLSSPSDLEQRSLAHILRMFERSGLTRADAAGTTGAKSDVPLNAFVRTHDDKIVHVGMQGKTFWLNVMVNDTNHPTSREALMLNIHANGYRNMGNTAEGTAFKEYAATHLTGPVSVERSTVLKKLRAAFGMAA